MDVSKSTLLKLEDLPEGASRSITLKAGSHEPQGFVVRKDGEVFAYLNRCPHTGAPLDWSPHQFLDADGAYIMCAVHGALFEIKTGLCVHGPCVNQRLEPLPIEIEAERLRLKER